MARWVRIIGCVGVLSSCIDLDIPAPAARGGLTGSVDTSAGRPAISPEGHTLRLVDAAGSARTQVSGPMGGFTFGDLAPGVYSLELKVPGFAPDVEVGLKVSGGQTLDVGRRALVWLGGTVAEATVSGRVATADNADPTGAQVGFLLQPANTLVALSTIGSTGEFVTKVPPGTYRLRATHTLYVTSMSADVAVAEGATMALSSPLVLDLNPATVSGLVRKERSGADGGFDPVPAAGVVVTVEPGGMTTSTGADGRFALGGLSAGPKSVRLSLADHHDPAAQHPVTLTPGQTSMAPDVTLLLDRGDLVGTVELADRQPVLNVAVSVTGTNASALVVPDPAEPFRGTFRLTGLPVATGYEVVALKSGYSRAVRGGQGVTKGAVTNVGPLTLTALRGDFLIDDGDSSNTAGFTRTAAVTLELQGFATMGAARFRASESPQFPDAGYSPFTGARQAFSLSASQGTHTVYAQYEDASGTPSQVFVSTVVLDAVAPTMATLVLADGASFSANGVSVAGRLEALEEVGPSVDAVSGLREVRVAESATVDSMGRLPATPAPYRRDFTHLRQTTGDGPFTLCAQVFDHAGNFTAPVCDGLTIDTQRPVGSLTIRRGARATVDGFTNVERVFVDGTATAEPHGGALSIRLASSLAGLSNAPTVAFASPAVLQWDVDPAGADGPRALHYELVDSAGNVSAMPLSTSIILDRAPPSAAPLSTVPGSPSRAALVAVAVAASDATSGLAPMALTLSEDAVFAGPTTVGPLALPPGGTTPFTFSAGDGAKQLYARFRDGAGNDAVLTTRVDVDTTPPVGSVRLEGVLGDGAPSETVTNSATITAVLTQLGASGHLVGNETLTACPSTGYSPLPTNGRVPVTLSGAASPREVRVCLIDEAGNTLGPLISRITLDASTPSGCALSLAGSRYDGTAAPTGQTARSTVSASLTGCSETPSEWVLTEGAVTCTTAGLPWVPVAPGTPVPLLGGDGAHTVRACVRDSARNVATATAATVTVDSTPPSAVGVVLNAGAAFVNATEFVAQGNQFRVTVTGSATDATEWALSTTGVFSTFEAFPPAMPRRFTFAGTGTQRLSALFRDALGNPSVVVFDDITLDITAPTVGGVTLSLVTSAPDPAFIASDAVGARLLPAPPADATRLFFAQTSQATSCASGAVFTGASARPVTNDVSFIASGGDGAKRLCLLFADDADNRSTPLTLDFTVDTTPPSAPELSTPSALTRLADDALFTVALARPITETNFLRTERLGGKTASWTNTGATVATTSFSFNLVSSVAVSSTANVLQLRAVDRAGNVGPSSSITVTTDIQPPDPPQTNRLGVSNFTQAAAVFWAPSTSTDVASYRVEYGPSTGQYDGTHASEGQSPIVVPAAQRQLSLHGLVDGTPTYVRLSAVDHAGNVGPGSSEVVLQPNRVSPTLIAETEVSAAAGGIGRLVVQDDVVFGLGANTGCFPTAASALVFFALDLGALRSATQSGQLENPAPSPPVLWTTSIAATLTNSDCYDVMYDLLVDGPWAYVVVGSSLRVYRVTSRGAAPPLVATIPLGFVGQSLTLQGNTLFVNGVNTSTMRTNIAAVDVGPLFDEAVGTTPTVGAVITNNTLPANAGATAFIVTRTRGIQVPLVDQPSPHWNVTDAVDGSPAGWDDADYLSTVGGDPMMNPNIGGTTHPPFVSGNRLISYVDGRVQARSLRNLWTTAAGSAGRLESDLLVGTQALPGMLAVAGRDVVAAQREGASLLSIDATNVSTSGLTIESRYQLDPFHRPKAAVSFGPYLLLSTRTGRVQFYELATPRALRVASTQNRGARFVPNGTFFYGANGSVLDLQAGPTPVELVGQLTASFNPFVCSTDVVAVHDFAVSAPVGESRLNVFDVSKATDRDENTSVSLSPFNDGYEVALPNVRSVVALETWGNFVVALEARPAGFFLEVFRATALRDLVSGTQLSAADSLGSFQLNTRAPSIPVGDLALSRGRAFVTFGAAHESAEPNSVTVVDFRNLVDDSAATTGFVSQGSLPVAGAQNIVVSGGRAFVTTYPFPSPVLLPSLEVWNVSAAMDDSAGTVLSETAPLGSLAFTERPVPVQVYGGYAFVMNSEVEHQARVMAIDVGNPASPRVASLAVAGVGSTGCGGTNHQGVLYGTLHVLGSRLFISGHGATSVLELE